MHAVRMRTLKTLKTSRCITRGALVHRRNVTCAEEDTVFLPAPLSLMKGVGVHIAMMLIAMMVLMSRILFLHTTRDPLRNVMLMDASTSGINVSEGGHGSEGGQCPDCGTTNLCCY